VPTTPTTRFRSPTTTTPAADAPSFVPQGSR
jgi:hypothetical protein